MRRYSPKRDKLRFRNAGAVPSILRDEMDRPCIFMLYRIEDFLAIVDNIFHELQDYENIIR